MYTVLRLRPVLLKIVIAIWQYVSVFTSKRSLARILSTLLCCIVIVIHPFSDLGGPYAFLVLSLKELVFSVQESLAQQLESTILNVLGAMLGIAVSTLAKFIASRTPEDSIESRATCAIFLVVISFIAGLVKSRLPRLQPSTRISCFVSVWILTNDVGLSTRIFKASENFLWVTLAAAVIPLVSLLLLMSLLHWSSTNFEREIASTFSAISTCLSMGLDLAFPHPNVPPTDPEEYRKIKLDLLSRSVRLNENYSQAAFELRIGRLSLRSIRPLITVVEHLRRELSWGMPLRGSSQLNTAQVIHSSSIPSSPLARTPSRATEELESSVKQLGKALLASMQCVENTITLAFHQTDPPARLFTWNPPSPNSVTREASWTYSQSSIINEAESQLLCSRTHTAEVLKKMFDDMGSEEGELTYNTDMGSHLATIALLQMVQDARAALRVARRFATLYEETRSRLWYPRFSLAWLGVPPGPHVSDDPNALLAMWDSESDLALQDNTTVLSDSERTRGLAETVHRINVRQAALKEARMQIGVKDGKKRIGLGCSWSGFCNWLESIWSSRRGLKLRMRLSRLVKAVKHSNHLRHALKNACGVALLSFPAFMPAESAGRKWFVSVRGQWLVISYLWVLETNTGATWRTGYLRILGTIYGAIYGYITWLICRTNPYALTVLVTAGDIPFTWLITQTNLAAFAVPAYVAIPPIVYSQYIRPDPTTSVLRLALLRSGTISAGMSAALLMNSLVFPRHCRVYFLSDTSRTLGLLTDLYLTLSHDMLQENHTFTKDERAKILKLELQIRNGLHRLNALIVTMHHELGLLPKPLQHYRRVVSTLQNALDLMTGLRKIRECIPRKIAVSQVFRERQEFMSCVCITLFACQHAFRAQEPLPQFLPSTRHALRTLENSVQERIQKVRQEDPHGGGLSFVYALAEQEVLGNLVATLEVLLQLTGNLFGTSTWLKHGARLSRVGTEEDKGDELGWYSTFKGEEA